uniref:Uncharacterized protein n=1 Tax=Arundo donax TaxID=35708 RepID=A0A0A8XPN1_ARUDO
MYGISCMTAAIPPFLLPLESASAKLSELLYALIFLLSKPSSSSRSLTYEPLG